MRFIILGLIMQSLAFSSPIAFINAQIFDGINERKDADAFLVEDGRFKKIASTQEILTHVDLKQVVDLQSLRVMPGFIESHGHLLGLGLSLQKLDLRHLSITRIAELVKAQTERQAYGTWIQGRNWDQNIWPDKEFPTKEVLDKLSPNHPVYLRRVDGHAAWLNSLALERAGINKNSPDPKGGIIVRNEKGEASGVLIDNAMDLVNAILDKPSRLELEEQLALAMKEANRFGISSFHDAGASKEALELFRNFAQNNKLTLRIYAMIDGDNKDLLSSSLAKGPEVINDFLSIRAIKLFADGALGSRGALLIDDYHDKAQSKGLALITKDELTAISQKALQSGFQIATHAIGDQANRMVLDAYEDALTSYTGKNPRLRIEHAQIVDQKDHERFSQLNIIASMQPIHCTSDMAWVEERLGKERLNARAYPWRSLLNHHVMLAFGSDTPVESPNPLLGLYAAVTRSLPESDIAFMPEERLSLKEALAGYMQNAAYAEFAEDKKGIIKEGYLADFIAVNNDILHSRKTAFTNAHVVLTVVNGDIVYQDHNLSL